MELFAKIVNGFGKHCAGVFSLIKLLAALKKETPVRYRCFLVNFAKFLRTPISGTPPPFDCFWKECKYNNIKMKQINMKHNYILPHFIKLFLQSISNGCFLVLQKLAKILANLKKIQRNSQCSLFNQNFTTSLMAHLANFFFSGKKSYEQKRRGRYFPQNKFIYGQCFKCWGTKIAITTTNCVGYLLELERKLEFIWNIIFSELSRHQYNCDVINMHACSFTLKIFI